MNVIVDELLSLLKIDTLLDSIFEEIAEAIGLPDDFGFENPVDGLIDLDLGNLLKDFDTILREMRNNLMADLTDPVDRINDAAEAIVERLNTNSGGYDIKTASTHDKIASWICPVGTQPIVATATYIGPNCVDSLDGVWRLPCDGTDNACEKEYLDTRLTCVDQSLDEFISPEPLPSLTLAPSQHTFSSVYICVPPGEIDNLGIMPILNTKDSSGTSVSPETMSFQYNLKNVCTNFLQGTINERDLTSSYTVTQNRLDPQSLATTDELVCSGDARSVYLEYRGWYDSKEIQACIDFNGPVYKQRTDSYGIYFLCLDMLDDINLGEEGGSYPNNVGFAYCMHPAAEICNYDPPAGLALVPNHSTSANCELSRTALEGASSVATQNLNSYRMAVWDQLQTTKDLYVKSEGQCFKEYSDNCEGNERCTAPDFCPSLTAQYACIPKIDARDQTTRFSFGESLSSSSTSFNFICPSHQNVIVRSAATGRGLGGLYNDVTNVYQEN